MMIVGIDPGKRGGIAIYEDGRVFVEKMPDDVLKLGRRFSGTGALVFLEKLSIRPDDMDFKKAARIQRMLRDYERIKAGFEANDVSYVMVHPMKWQSYLGVHLKGVERAERKKRYKEIAQRLFPNIRVTLLNADALLILLFGLRILKEKSSWARANCPVDIEEIIIQSKQLVL